MRDSDTRGDTFWQYSWDCKQENFSLAAPAAGVMNSDSAAAAAAGTIQNSTNPVVQQVVHDDMTSWLHLDDPSYCAQLASGELNRACASSVQVFRDTRLQQGFSSSPELQRQRSDAALAMAAGRAAGFFPQSGGEAFHRSRTVLCQPSSRPSFMQSGSESRPQPWSTQGSPLASPSSTPAPRVGCEAESFPVASRKSVDYWKTQATNSLDSDRSTLDSRSVRVKVTGPASFGAPQSSRETSSMRQADTFTASTGGSWSDVDRGEKDSKRKEKEVEDTAGNDESPDKRKPPRSKRSRAAEVHNLSERKRRDRINERMKALQELIPNSNKTDKASMLDEAIEYLKMLQHQLQMMSMRSGMMSPITALPHMQMPPAYGGINMGVRLVDVSGHQTLIQQHHPGVSVNVAVPMNGFIQGMNSDICNAQVINQHQTQQQQQLQLQHQLQEPYIQPQLHKQEQG